VIRLAAKAQRLVRNSTSIVDTIGHAIRHEALRALKQHNGSQRTTNQTFSSRRVQVTTRKRVGSRRNQVAKPTRSLRPAGNE
jgi:hypothetical protein